MRVANRGTVKLPVVVIVFDKGEAALDFFFILVLRNNAADVVLVGSQAPPVAFPNEIGFRWGDPDALVTAIGRAPAIVFRIGKEFRKRAKERIARTNYTDR